MRLANDPQTFGAVSKLLHWLTALCIVGLIALGFYMVDLTYFDRWYNESLSIHKALGMLVLALGMTTFLWRFISPSPAALASLKPWERVAAHAMHHTLLTLVIVIPLSGYLISTSAGKPIAFFGWFDIPPLIAVDAKMRDLAIEVHYYLAYTTGLLVLLHAAAAVKHQLIDRDGTLARMIWR